MTSRRRHGHLAILSGAAVVLASCTVTTTFQQPIEVKRGGTIEEKVAIAKAVVTEERLARLRQEVKERVPGAADGQLVRLGLRWNEVHFKSLGGDGKDGTTVTVSVGIQTDGSFDPHPIVAAALAILEPEINGTSGPGA